VTQDILQLIQSHKEVTHIIVLTHDVDFLFVEHLLLDVLHKCGTPRLTVYADAGRAAESYALQSSMVTQLGRRYRVVPVPMPPGFRFHPKAVLLSGRREGTLLVGSGNLTYGGWRENAEIWTDYKTGEGLQEFSAFRDYLRQIVNRLSLSQNLRDEIDEAFDGGTRDWATQLPTASGLLTRCGREESLLDQMKMILGPQPVDRLTVCAPYFDPEGEALRLLAAACDAQETLVLSDRSGTNLTSAAACRQAPSVKLHGASGRPRDGGTQHRPFLHAKFYAFRRADDVVLISGSANCSRAALAIAGLSGNAELVSVRRMSVAEFDESVVRSIEVDPTAPPFVPLPENRMLETGSFRPQVLAARLTNDRLEIAYTPNALWKPHGAVFDSCSEVLSVVSSGNAVCLAPTHATRVGVVGELDGELLETAPHWIDHEVSLARTAYQRSLEATLRSKARESGEWNLGDWQEVVRIFCRDLDYAGLGSRDRRTNRGSEDAPDANVFCLQHVFRQSIEISAPTIMHEGVSTAERRAAGLSALLLRWFGLRPSEDVPQGPKAEEEPEPRAIRPGEETVDKPVGPKTPPPPPPPPPITEKDRQKARQVIGQMATFMTASNYLRHRELTGFARDIELASLLLRMVQDRCWLSREETMEATVEIWAALFLSGDEGAPLGWLEARRVSEWAEFQKHVCVPAVTAALFAWGLEANRTPTTPREAQALLALALSLARHPWVWVSDKPEQVAAELDTILRATAGHYDEAMITQSWQELMSLAGALLVFDSTLQAALSGGGVMNLVSQNQRVGVSRGELLWQGRLGYCVAGEDANRGSRNPVNVLPLQLSGIQGTKVSSAYLNPISGLMDIPDLCPGLSESQRQLLRELSRRFGRTCGEES
jgi:hypothetical protein